MFTPFSNFSLVFLWLLYTLACCVSAILMHVPCIYILLLLQPTDVCVYIYIYIYIYISTISAGERPAAARLLRSWVRIPPGAWIFVCCDCHVLSGRGLCDELITRPEESYRLWCVVVCDLETSRIGTPYIYIYDISSLRVNDLTLIMLTWRKW